MPPTTIDPSTIPMSPKATDKREPRRERPGSLAYFEVLEELRELHTRKSQDYGAPTDPLANIRAGAEFVGIEPWRATLIRVADKIQRLKTFCRDGRLSCESVEDGFLDLASYAIIGLVMYREAVVKETVRADFPG